MSDTGSGGIAIIGLSGRFPQCADVEALWTLLRDGREGVVAFSDEELLGAGVSPALLANPAYVRAGTIVPDVDHFDADFFKLSARDADVADPQRRLFMECAWQALEQAGYPPARTKARIGLYAGVGENTYLRHHLEPNLATLLSTVGDFRLATLNSGDFLATYTAYKLNLTGPALNVQTACSTSLVAIHVACQSLLNFECDLALAGGVSIFLPQGRGYLYQEGMIASPDGACRAFDERAEGTITGGGVGVVLLKRLDEAIEDRDTVHAVILGSAINNDGADKIGFTAPSVSGQTDVILEAQAAAGVHPDEIGYIEAHGTGTRLGDLIEIQSLTQAFRARTRRTGYCAIGSIKTNIGHTDTAAGVAGVIKTVLALRHRQLPRSLHFETPNPQIDFATSPFFVNDRLRDWQVADQARRCAGVSAFGIGGTNAHVILAEAPASDAVQPSSSAADRSLQLLCLSARTETALTKARQNLGRHLRKEADLDLADVAHTLQVGRQEFSHRQVLVCRDTEEAAALLETTDPLRIASQHAREAPPAIVFMFPGAGSQYSDMGRTLYEASGVVSLAPYREQLGQCLNTLLSRFDIDLKPVLFPEGARTAGDGSSTLEKASWAYPALFITEYALARLWLSWGIRPTAMIGHGIGEYVAACLAGVFSLDDGLSMVMWRARLDDAVPASPGESRQRLERVRFSSPTLPFVSSVTGTWIRPEEATSPDYWMRHLSHPVRFADGLDELLRQPNPLFLEVGPGHTLRALVQAHAGLQARHVLSSLPQRADAGSDWRELLHALGHLWLNGAEVNWPVLHSHDRCSRIPLPTYPFERRRHWIDAPRQIAHAAAEAGDTATLQPGVPLAAPPSAVTTPAKRARSPLELEIGNVWSDSLGIADIDRDADFFDLGGDSLLATQVAERLRTHMRIDLDTHSLLEAPTIGQLAALIAAERTKATGEARLPELLVELQAGEPGRRPLVLVHPVGGHVYFYRQMVRRFDPRLPVYGIRARGAEGEAEPLTSVEEMAQVYNAALRELQPRGPYYLGGASFGGTVAFAMAQQLTARAEEVAFLALIDTPSPRNVPKPFEEVVDILLYLLRAGNGAGIDVDALRAMDEGQQLEFFMQHGTWKFASLQELKIMLTLFKANERAMCRYAPEIYPGKLHFYLARERDALAPETPAHGWIDLAALGMEIYTVPGSHISMNEEPHVQYLARHLEESLKRSMGLDRSME